MLLLKKSQVYKLLVDKLYDKCQRIQAENERSVMRVNGLKKILRRRIQDVELLKRRLDKHGDNWRLVPMVAAHPKGKIEQKRGPKPKNKQATTAPPAPGESPTTATVRKPRKQRVKKVPMDAPAPSITPAPPQQQQQQMLAT